MTASGLLIRHRILVANCSWKITQASNATNFLKSLLSMCWTHELLTKELDRGQPRFHRLALPVGPVGRLRLQRHDAYGAFHWLQDTAHDSRCVAMEPAFNRHLSLHAA